MKKLLGIVVLTLQALFVQAQSDSTVLLAEVIVTADGEDPAYAMIRAMRDNRRAWRKADQSYVGDLYSTGFKRNESDALTFEQLSTLNWMSNDVYQQVLGYKNYRSTLGYAGEEITIEFGGEYSFNNNFQVPEAREADKVKEHEQFTRYYIDPFIAGTAHEEALRTITGLATFNSTTAYDFRLDYSYMKDSLTYHVIAVKPKTATGGWVGELVILDGEFIPVTLNLQLSDQTKARSLYVSWAWEFSTEEPWLPTKFKRITGEGATEYVLLANITNWRIEKIELESKNQVLWFSEDYELVKQEVWADHRPEALNEKRGEWANYQDSIIRYYNSDHYLDSIDAIYNKFHWYEPLIGGMGWRKRSKGNRIWVNSITGQWNFIGIGGTRWTPVVIGSKRFNDESSLSVFGNLNYGFLNQDLKGSLHLGYTYDPKHNGELKLSFGDEYMPITQSIDITGMFARSNYIRKTFVTLGQRREWFNGFYSQVSLEYSTRRSIEGLEFSQWSQDLFGERNQPEPFDTYTVTQVGLDILYRPFQRYYMKGKRKIVLSSDWPDIGFQLYQGLPNVFGSDVAYTKYNVRIEDYMNFKQLGYMNWNLVSGGFLGNTDSIRFIEYKWFRGADYYLFTHPLYTHQTLDSTFASPKPYIQGYGIHHFDGYFLGRIPFLKRLKLGTAIGFSTLIQPTADVYFMEMYVGVERVFKLWGESVRYGIYRPIAPYHQPDGFRFKIGIDVRDSFWDRWNY